MYCIPSYEDIQLLSRFIFWNIVVGQIINIKCSIFINFKLILCNLFSKMDSKDSEEKRPLSFASNSSEGSQFIILKKTEQTQLGESFLENSEGCVQENYSVQNSISKFPSEPCILNNVKQIKAKSSSLCNFYQYYYDQFLTAKSNKFDKNNEEMRNDASNFGTSIRNVIKELVETESSYVKDLQEIIEVVIFLKILV